MSHNTCQFLSKCQSINVALRSRLSPVNRLKLSTLKGATLFRCLLKGSSCYILTRLGSDLFYVSLHDFTTCFLACVNLSKISNVVDVCLISCAPGHRLVVILTSGLGFLFLQYQGIMIVISPRPQASACCLIQCQTPQQLLSRCCDCCL